VDYGLSVEALSFDTGVRQFIPVDPFEALADMLHDSG
jgi:hypothetical protein